MFINSEYKILKALYFHFPYCIHKCSYCDFYSIPEKKASNNFIDAVIKEIEIYSSKYDCNLETIFFGGGTPSLLSKKQFHKIVNEIYKRFSVAKNYEFTIESNPGAVDMENISFYREMGVNRISMGVQSFNEDELEFLERIHSPSEAEISFYKLRKTGFENINLDMIFSLPNQTEDKLLKTINKFIELNPEHISAYSLIYEKGTPLYKDLMRGEIHKLDDEEDSELYFLIVKELTNAGYLQYEVSNYSKPDKQCKHNLKYWNSENYLGIGPSAHGFIGKKRYWNYRSINKYISNLKRDELPTDGYELLKKTDFLYEKLFLKLRADGLNIKNFITEFNIKKDSIYKIIEELIKYNYCTYQDNILKLTSQGYFIGDEISLKFINNIDFS